eukprot:6849579-Prymnesium_polylepis.3
MACLHTSQSLGQSRRTAGGEGERDGHHRVDALHANRVHGAVVLRRARHVRKKRCAHVRARCVARWRDGAVGR